MKSLIKYALAKKDLEIAKHNMREDFFTTDLGSGGSVTLDLVDGAPVFKIVSDQCETHLTPEQAENLRDILNEKL